MKVLVMSLAVSLALLIGGCGSVTIKNKSGETTIDATSTKPCVIVNGQLDCKKLIIQF